MVEVLMVLALAGTGLVAGGAAGTSFALLPMLSTLPADNYTRAQSFLVGRPDRFIPAVFAATALCDGVLAGAGSGTGPRLGFGIAAVLLAAGALLSLVASLPAGRAARSVAGLASLRTVNLAVCVLAVAVTALTFAAVLAAGR